MAKKFSFERNEVGDRLAFIRDLLKQVRQEVQSIDENVIQNEDSGLVLVYEHLEAAENELDSEITRIEAT